MLAKFLSRIAAAALLLAAMSVAASAQVITATGKVMLRQADGTEVPVQNAVVDFFRTDIKQKFQTKTDKKGVYIHAGIPLVGIFTITVSVPGARPTFATDIKISAKPENNFVLDPDDGSALTPEQIKQFAAPAKLIEEDKKRAAEEAAERARIKAEQQRQAEIQRQEKLKKRQEDHRARARDVLPLLKANSPEQYSFSGYSTQNTLEKIYRGDFEQFTGGFESLADATKSVRSAFGNADPRNPFGFLAELVASGFEVEDMVNRRRSINTIFYTYHNVYKDQCYSNKEVPWEVSEIWVFFLSQGDVRVEGSEKTGVVILIRAPYKETYDRVYSSLANTSNVSPSLPESYANDFRQFLKAEGCASPAVRRFEVNLYLATGWLLSLHELGVPAPVEFPKPVPNKLQMNTEEPKQPASPKLTPKIPKEEGRGSRRQYKRAQGRTTSRIKLEYTLTMP